MDSKPAPDRFPQEIHNARHLLIHYSEIALKGKNRYLFEDKLIHNLLAKLGALRPCSVRKLPGRILASFADPIPWITLCNTPKEVFGVSSISPAWLVPPHMTDLEKTVSHVIASRKFSTYAVRTKRGEKGFPFNSQEVNKQIGALVNKVTGAKVNLDNPEQTIWIEILNSNIFVYLDRLKGYDGLPVGVSGRVVSLLSGGIDSPVATWRIMRRGCEATLLHFHSAPFTTEDSKEKAVELAESLGRFQPKTRLALLPLGDIQKKIVTTAPNQYRVVLYRRFMLRIAEKIAHITRARALVTGEALGQVASQTISNLSAVEAVTNLPILRPLIGMDKEEITRTARDIGTYEISIKPHSDCCSFLQPKYPAIRTTPEELDRAEEGLDIEKLVSDAVSKAEWRDVPEVSPLL